MLSAGRCSDLSFNPIPRAVFQTGIPLAPGLVDADHPTAMAGEQINWRLNVINSCVNGEIDALVLDAGLLHTMEGDFYDNGLDVKNHSVGLLVAPGIVIGTQDQSFFHLRFAVSLAQNLARGNADFGGELSIGIGGFNDAFFNPEYLLIVGGQSALSERPSEPDGRFFVGVGFAFHLATESFRKSNFYQ